MLRLFSLLLIAALVLCVVASGPSHTTSARIPGGNDKLASRPNHGHASLSRHPTRTSSAGNPQCSTVSYPICEGSPPTGEVVYGTMYDAVYSYVGQEWSETVQNLYECAQAYAAYVPGECRSFRPCGIVCVREDRPSEC
jgi:hypothetical protein